MPPLSILVRFTSRGFGQRCDGGGMRANGGIGIGGQWWRRLQPLQRYRQPSSYASWVLRRSHRRARRRVGRTRHHQMARRLDLLGHGREIEGHHGKVFSGRSEANILKQGKGANEPIYTLLNRPLDRLKSYSFDRHGQRCVTHHPFKPPPGGFE